MSGQSAGRRSSPQRADAQRNRGRLLRADLIEAVYDHRIRQLCAAAAELAEVREPATALREWLRALVAHITDSRVLADAFTAAYEGRGEAAPPQVAAWHSALFDAALPLLTTAQGAGAIRPDLTLMELMALTAAVARAGDPAHAERFLDVLLEGIIPRPASGLPAPVGREPRRPAGADGASDPPPVSPCWCRRPR